VSTMPPAEFARLAARTGLAPQSVAMARRVLVEGVAQSDVAREVGAPRQRVQRAVARVVQAIHEDGRCPTCGQVVTAKPG
jgi:hypothetical protein